MEKIKNINNSVEFTEISAEELNGINMTDYSNGVIGAAAVATVLVAIT